MQEAFGKLYLDAQRLLRLGLEAAARRWNFDFLTEAPGAAGNPEWEELSARDVPAFYRSRAAPGGAPGGGGGARQGRQADVHLVGRGIAHVRQLLRGRLIKPN
ncbi:unnamed protein product [Menidia menidia]|uniref:(Atlantic silverside) hypothetical protein n=1 Tax=Menidia menidia TaxID=238744 RepID=A0A8S4BM69_9TELE|nr:unnamed protein product [Menidia menidia]CAG6016189.1 unnamed protein product [Menidia menidia]